MATLEQRNAQAEVDNSEQMAEYNNRAQNSQQLEVLLAEERQQRTENNRAKAVAAGFNY